MNVKKFFANLINIKILKKIVLKGFSFILKNFSDKVILSNLIINHLKNNHFLLNFVLDKIQTNEYNPISEIAPYLVYKVEKGREIVDDRYSYQKKYNDFDIKETEKVLDIGSGAYPFPLATHLADLYSGETTHRTGEIVLDNRPFFECNIEKMPFKDNEFDFTYCSHLLEHVENPHIACEEIMRISKRGYIETPTKTSDMMYNFTHLKNHHKWHVNIINNTIVFIEWKENERRNMGTNYFFNMIQSKWKNPFQEIVYDNVDMFVGMLKWTNHFYYMVINNKGEIVKTNLM